MWHVPNSPTDKMTFPSRESQLRWYQRLVFIVLNFFFAGPTNGPFYAINTKRNHFLSLHYTALAKTDYIAFMQASGFDYVPAMNSYDKYVKGVRWTRRFIIVIIISLFLACCMFFFFLSITTHTLIVDSDGVEYQTICRLSPQDSSCFSL